MKPTNIRAIAQKEIYHLIRDFRSLYLAFAIPLLLIFMFGYALRLDVDNVKTVVVDYDRTDLSRDFIRHLDASTYFHIENYLKNTQAVTKYLDHGWATLAVIIPPGWTKNIHSDRDAPMQVILDGSDPNFAGITRGYITAFIEQYNQKNLLRYLNRQGRNQMNVPVEGRIRVWFNEDLESRNFIIPGIIAIIIMLAGAMLTSLVIAREYENGTMETIKSLPIGAAEFIIGKAVPYFLIGLTDVLIAVLMGQVFFGIVMKSSFWLMILASCLYLFVALGLGLLISVITKSQLIANMAAILLTFLPSILLSNFVFPIINMPKILQIITYVVPARYYIEILSGIYLKHLDFIQMWSDFLVLLLMFLIMSAMNIRLLKKEGL
ncbi:MAG: ABC transporter permease [Deltaproteobacteria bacterium]|nr:ABC transporter permease [Deltaproteobacteria bacterium]